jgi:MFS family permease
MLMRITVPQAARRSGSPLAHIVEGFRFVISNRPIHYLMMLLGILSITSSPVMVLMPIFADRILHGGARGLGVLMGAGGIGAVIGALWLASRQSVHGLGRWVAVAAASFGGCVILFALSHNLWLSFAILLPIGMSLMVEMGSTNTLLQTMSPDHLRGRVISVYSMAMMGLAPVGSLFGGIAAARFGAPATLIGGGVICMLAAAVFGRRLASIRAEARQLIATAHVSAPVK